MAQPALPMREANRRASFWPRRRAVAGTDDGQRRPQQLADVAFHIEQRRRHRQYGQRRRVARLDGEQRTGADALGRFQLGFGVGTRAGCGTILAAATAGQLRQRLKGLHGATELIDELAEGDRPHIGGCGSGAGRPAAGSHRGKPAAAGRGSGALANAAAAHDLAPILLSSPGEQAANIAFMLQENEDGHNEYEEQAGLAEG